MTAIDSVVGGLRLPHSTSTMSRSGIRRIMDLALAQRECIRLELGEPDFPTAPNIIAAAHQAAVDGKTKYTKTTGLPALRAALSEKIRTRNGFDVHPDNVLVSSGAVQGLYAALVGLVDPGDGVLLPSPGWPNYQMMCRLLRADGRDYHLRPENGYLPSVDDLEPLVDARTRVLVLNSPSNPVGSVIHAAAMAELLDFAHRHDLWVVSDECYDELTYGVPHVSAGTLDDHGRVISVFSFSKTYAMTGWRIGYVAMPERVTSTLSNVHESMLSCVAMPTQLAALEAVTGPQTMVEQMRTAYRHRRDVALARLESQGVRAFRPDGAFYLWIDVAESGMDGGAFAEELVTRGVAVAPGTAFGPHGAGAVRMSIAAGEHSIVSGVDILADLLRELSDSQ